MAGMEQKRLGRVDALYEQPPIRCLSERLLERASEMADRKLARRGNFCERHPGVEARLKQAGGAPHLPRSESAACDPDFIRRGEARDHTCVWRHGQSF